jgi:hypothetical protein
MRGNTVSDCVAFAQSIQKSLDDSDRAERQLPWHAARELSECGRAKSGNVLVNHWRS